MADASTPNATDEIELWSLDSEVAAALPAPGLGAAEGTGYAEQSAADLTAEPASGGEAAAVGLPYPFALPDAGMPVAMDTTETLPGIMPGQTGLPAAWGNVVERLAQVEVKIQEADEAIADEHERGPERLLAVLTDPGLAGRIAERLYPALRRRLRGELLIDRERRGALADLR